MDEWEREQRRVAKGFRERGAKGFNEQARQMRRQSGLREDVRHAREETAEYCEWRAERDWTKT